MVRWLGGLLVLAMSLAAAGSASADCKLLKRAELPITMVGARPLAPAKINGSDVRFLVDSGAFFSTLSSAAAQEFDLHTMPAPFGFTLEGVGGKADVSLTRVKRFTLARTCWAWATWSTTSPTA